MILVSHVEIVSSKIAVLDTALRKENETSELAGTYRHRSAAWRRTIRRAARSIELRDHAVANRAS
jgi:hypothetical protein